MGHGPRWQTHLRPHASPGRGVGRGSSPEPVAALLTAGLSIRWRGRGGDGCGGEDCGGEDCDDDGNLCCCACAARRCAGSGAGCGDDPPGEGQDSSHVSVVESVGPLLAARPRRDPWYDHGCSEGADVDRDFSLACAERALDFSGARPLEKLSGWAVDFYFSEPTGHDAQESGGWIPDCFCAAALV